MTSNVFVFYAGMLYGEFTRKGMYSVINPIDNPEIYNGAFVYLLSERGWYRCDMTPVLLEDVPKELRTAVLLLT